MHSCKDYKGRSFWDHTYYQMDHPMLVPQCDEYHKENGNNPQKGSLVATKTLGYSSLAGKNVSGCSASLCSALGCLDMPELTRDIILLSWRHSTKNKYASVWARWQRFCLKKGISSTRTSINYVLEFFINLYTTGCHYSGLCAARSALSSLIHIEEGPSISAHPITTRFLKGVCNRHPPSPRYLAIWDVDKVLSYFNSKEHNDKLSCKELCYKTVTLLMILGAYIIIFYC